MKTTNKTLFVVLPLAAAVNAAWAQAADDDYTTLDTSVVSAAGYEQDTRDAPATVSIVSGAELETRPVADLAQAIEDVPGVEVEQTKMGGHTIRLRGFESKYTLILIDGKRQNIDDGFVKNGFDPSGNFLPSMSAIDRIEVLRGPASTIYGSDAVGGVVNIITKKHPKALTGSIGLEGTAQEHREDYGNSWGTNFYFANPLIDDTLSMQLRGRYYAKSAGGLKDATGDYASHSPSEGFTGNLGGRLTYTLNDANTVYVDGDFYRFKGGSMSTSANGEKSLWWATKANLILAHEGKYDIGETETYFQYNGTENTNTTSELSAANYIFSTKLVSPIDFGAYGSMVLSSGLEFWYDTFRDDSSAEKGKLNFAGDTSIVSTIAGSDLHHTQISGFLEGEYFITDNWSATAGARLTWSDIFGSHVAPRAYLVWKPAEVISFKGGVSAGYKTPAVKELTDGVYEVNGGGKTTSGRWYYPRYGNPDLKPEESWNYELSADVRFGQFAAMTVSGFYTDFKNKIDYEAEYDQNGKKALERRINLGKVEAKGVEVSLRTKPIYGVSFTAGYTYTDSKVKTEGKKNYNQPVSSLPKHAVSAKVDYTQGGFNSFLRMRAKFDTPNIAGKTGLPNDKYPKFNNYTLFDLGLNYQLGKNHKFAFVVNNLFDKEFVDWADDGSTNLYRDYLEGRNYWFSYNYSF